MDIKMECYCLECLCRRLFAGESAQKLIQEDQKKPIDDLKQQQEETQKTYSHHLQE